MYTQFKKQIFASVIILVHTCTALPSDYDLDTIIGKSISDQWLIKPDNINLYKKSIDSSLGTLNTQYKSLIADPKAETSNIEKISTTIDILTDAYNKITVHTKKEKNIAIALPLQVLETIYDSDSSFEHCKKSFKTYISRVKEKNKGLCNTDNQDIKQYHFNKIDVAYVNGDEPILFSELHGVVAYHQLWWTDKPIPVNLKPLDHAVIPALCFKYDNSLKIEGDYKGFGMILLDHTTSSEIMYPHPDQSEIFPGLGVAWPLWPRSIAYSSSHLAMTYHKAGSDMGHPVQFRPNDECEIEKKDLINAGILIYENPHNERRYAIDSNNMITVQKQQKLCQKSPLIIDNNPHFYSVTALHLGELTKVVACSLRSEDNESTITIEPLPRSKYVCAKEKHWFSWEKTKIIAKESVQQNSYSCIIPNDIVTKIIQISHTNFLCLTENGTLYKVFFGKGKGTLEYTKITQDKNDTFIDIAYDKTHSAIALLESNGSTHVIPSNSLIKGNSLINNTGIIKTESLHDELPKEYGVDFLPYNYDDNALEGSKKMIQGEERQMNHLLDIAKKESYWNENKEKNNQKISYSKGIIQIWTEMKRNQRCYPTERRYHIGYVVQEYPCTLKENNL